MDHQGVGGHEGRREVEEARVMQQAGEDEKHGVEQRWLVRGWEAVRAAASQCFRVGRHNIRETRPIVGDLLRA